MTYIIIVLTKRDTSAFTHKHSEFIFLLPKFIYSKVKICNIYYLKSFSQGAL